MANIIDDLNTLNTNLDNAKFKIAKNLKGKGVQALPSDKLDALADKIVDIPAGSCNLQELTVTENGIYTPQAGDVKGYNKVTVNVPTGGGGTDIDMGVFFPIPSSANKFFQDGYAEAKKIKDNWPASNTSMTQAFANNPRLVFMPMIDSKNVTTMVGTFYGDQNLRIVPRLDVSNVIDFQLMFEMCSNLRKVELFGFGTPSSVRTDNMFGSEQTVPKFLGFDGDGAIGCKQALYNTFYTYSFNRKAAGYSDLTINVLDSTLGLFTQAEKNAMKSKGYILENFISDNW